MKKFLLPLLLLFVAQLSFGQVGGFFKPLPLPGAELRASITATNPLVQNNIRPLFDVTATVLGAGTQLAGGFGVGLQHNVFNTTSNAWTTAWSASIIGFLGTTGTQMTGIGGLALGIPGTNGMIQVGPGYDFTNKAVVIMTGIGITFN